MPEIDDTLKERGARYGDFTDHAAIAQNLQDIVRLTPGWARSNSVQRQALTVILDKIARICNGDPNYDDNWRDIQGYAKLVEDRLPKVGTDLASAPDINVTSWRCGRCGKTIETPFSEHTCAPIDVLNNQATKQALHDDVNRARVAAGLTPKSYGTVHEEIEQRKRENAQRSKQAEAVASTFRNPAMKCLHCDDQLPSGCIYCKPRGAYGAIHTDGSRSGGQPIEITDDDRNFVWNYPIRKNLSYVQLMRGAHDDLQELQMTATFRRAAEKRGRQAQRKDDAQDAAIVKFEENCGS